MNQPCSLEVHIKELPLSPLAKSALVSLGIQTFELVKMTTTQPQTVQDEKITSRFDEKAGLDDTKYLATGNVDYTGSTAKTDPVEIRLVRKIDWRLMVSETRPVDEVRADNWQPTLCVMYFLNYVDRNAIAQARLNNLEEDLGMSGVQFNTTVSMSVSLGQDLDSTISNRQIQSVRWIRSHADSIQHANHAYKTGRLHECMDASMGYGIRLYCLGTELWRPCCL
jgi:hypothetical protein